MDRTVYTVEIDRVQDPDMASYAIVSRTLHNVQQIGWGTGERLCGHAHRSREAAARCAVWYRAWHARWACTVPERAAAIEIEATMRRLAVCAFAPRAQHAAEARRAVEQRLGTTNRNVRFAPVIPPSGR